MAIKQGAEVDVGHGFYSRNEMVAKSNAILAMTFGNGCIVKPGGTAHTVETYLNRIKKYGLQDNSYHYDLNSNMIFHGARTKNK